MQNFEHQEFLNLNNLRVENLPAPIRSKLEIFNQLAEGLAKQNTRGKALLEKKLGQLDLEILADMEMAFEDELENNELIEHEVKPVKPKKVEPPVEKSKNELLIDGLWKKGRRKVTRSELFSMGFQGNLSSKKLIAGPYELKKALFSYTYYINK